MKTLFLSILAFLFFLATAEARKPFTHWKRDPSPTAIASQPSQPHAQAPAVITEPSSSQ